MTNKEIYRRILKLLKPNAFLIIFSLILAVINVTATLTIPILTGRAVDCMIGPGNVDLTAITGILTVFLIVLIVNGLANFFMTIINNRVTFMTVHDLRRDMLKKMHTVPVTTLDAMGHGDLLSRTISDVERLSDGLLLGFSQLFTGVLTILGTLIFMFVTNGIISGIVVLITPVSLFAAAFISKKTYTHFKHQASLQGKMTGFINESVNSVRLIKAFSAEEAKEKAFDEINDEYAKVNLKALFYSSTTNPVTRFVNGLVYASVGIFGALLSISSGGKLTVGTLSCFLSYANQYTKPFNEISGVITEFQNAVACAGRIFEFLDKANTVDIVDTDDTEKENATPAADYPSSPVLEGNVSVRDLSFSYDKTKRLLYDISFDVKSGSHIAIVGPTGCGKTTFINLLMRFFEPDKGAILYDGIPSSRIHKKDLRKQIGMVLQDTWLKSDTVARNIAYGHPEASMEEIVNAAKKAHAHSFIMRLENGYDTVLSQDGGNLSAGQKQLLCIARLMLNLPPILILDEATSSIDTRTERKITDAFDTLMKGRTSFIVAHRLSTIRNADLILVMKDGNIIEQGNHDELLAQKGFYWQLLNS